ncbi:extracellular solute-binding protein [Atopococcus tabaci]|uniref:extracellular solute-binding protein n=1 Tax=Atopococcus tabaci TaxID=269774 RepID=UPI0003F9B03F|nr:extracellular solute-binding protein [Atopococcus tabaci]
MLKKKKHMGLLMAGAALLAACGNDAAAGEDGKDVVTLWAGGSDNVRIAMESVVDAFNDSEYGEDYELELEYILSGSGTQSLRDRIVAAQKAGETDTDYDLILTSDSEFVSYVEEGGEDIFTPVDFEKVPNAENLQASVSVGEDYLVPYRGTTVVLAYNSDNVPTPPKTADELYQWIKDNPGRFAYNTPGSGGAGSSFVTTAVYNSLPEEALTSQDESWKDQWDEGFGLLEELHPHMYQSGGQVVYPNKNQGTLDLLANQEVDIIPAWADMVIQQIGQGTLPESTKIAQIDPSFTGNVDAMVMPSIGSDVEGAHAVMDFMLTEEAQSILLDEMAAIPLIDAANLESENSALLEGLDVREFRVSSLGTLGTELNERWDQDIASLQ